VSAAHVVTLCGSMRFYTLMLRVACEETLAGSVVLMPFSVIAPSDQDGEVKQRLDLLHRRKIGMSDRVIVVSDLTGYHGASTTGEIVHAQLLGVPVTYRRVAPIPAPVSVPAGVDAPHTVVCGWGCGFLACSEAELDGHEADCDHDLHHNPTAGLAPAAGLPAPRPALPSRRAGVR
jgi:hypothetical protein